MRRAPLLVAVVTAASASCQLVYGLDDFHSTGSTSGAASAGGAHAGGGGGAGGSGAGAGSGGAPVCAAPTATCVAVPPAGFDGFFNLTEGDPHDAPDRCSSGAAPIYLHEGQPLGCSDCVCADPPTPACTAPGITSWLMSASCPTGLGFGLGTNNDACVKNQTSCKVADATPKACGASGGQIQETTFPEEATLCKIDPPAGDCEQGQTCAPTGSRVCIVQAGTVDCPSPWSERIVVYGNKTDDRACSMCTCSPNFTCNNGWNAFTSSDCSGAGSLLQPGSCSPAGSAIYEDLPPSGPLTCTASTVVETGSFTGTDPTTICCATL